MADDFASITESGPLVAELRARIERDGPITFREFMAAALYHPRYGYYSTNSGVTSRGGDYVTSPEVHPVFGALVAKQICELWRAIDAPARFDIVEQGAGRGLLARDVLAWAQTHEPAFAAAIRYGIVGGGAVLRSAQEATLADAGVVPGTVEWHDTFPPAVDGCVLSNELLDAFPVHRVVLRGSELLEVFVALDGDRFVDELRPLSDDALRRYFDDLGVLPGEGCYAEVNLDAPRWIAGVAAALRRGYVLTFDYGYEALELYAPWRRDGTLLSFYRQSAASDPYQRVGKQDLTSSVDFTMLKRAGDAAGLHAVAMTDQASFLVRLGVGEGVAAAAGEGAQLEEYFARRRVVMDLIDPARLGRVKVLLQAKGAPGRAPCGFRDV